MTKQDDRHGCCSSSVDEGSGGISGRQPANHGPSRLQEGMVEEIMTESVDRRSATETVAAVPSSNHRRRRLGDDLESMKNPRLRLGAAPSSAAKAKPRKSRATPVSSARRQENLESAKNPGLRFRTGSSSDPKTRKRTSLEDSPPYSSSLAFNNKSFGSAASSETNLNDSSNEGGWTEAHDSPVLGRRRPHRLGDDLEFAKNPGLRFGRSSSPVAKRQAGVSGASSSSPVAKRQAGVSGASSSSPPSSCAWRQRDLESAKNPRLHFCGEEATRGTRGTTEGMNRDGAQRSCRGEGAGGEEGREEEARAANGAGIQVSSIASNQPTESETIETLPGAVAVGPTQPLPTTRRESNLLTSPPDTSESYPPSNIASFDGDGNISPPSDRNQITSGLVTAMPVLVEEDEDEAENDRREIERLRRRLQNRPVDAEVIGQDDELDREDSDDHDDEGGRRQSQQQDGIEHRLATDRKQRENQGRKSMRTRSLLIFTVAFIIVVATVSVVLTTASGESDGDDDGATVAPGTRTARPAFAKHTVAPTAAYTASSTASSIVPSTSIPPKQKPHTAFKTTEELYGAVDSYLANPSPNTAVANTYGHPIGTWDVSAVTNFTSVFDVDRNADAKSFNGDLEGWDVSSAKLMRKMFHGAASFQGDLSMWNVSSVISMANTFDGAAAFQSDLSMWDVSSVTVLSGMFKNAGNFNCDLSQWDVSQVDVMSNMFEGASSFNGNTSTWDVGRVLLMSWMFADATSFNQSLCTWRGSFFATSVNFMFRNTACPNQNDPNLAIVSPLCHDCLNTEAD